MRTFTWAILGIAAVFSMGLFLPEARAQERRRIRAEVTPPTKEAMRELFASDLDVSHGHGGHFDMLLTSAELADLRARGFEARVLNENVYGGTRGGTFLPQYVSYTEAVARLNGFVATYPSLASLTDIGDSHQLRQIYALKISDNVAVDEDEPEVLFIGNHHAREVITVILPLALVLVFQRSEQTTREWIGAGLDLDLELLNLVRSEHFAFTRFGRYLQELRVRFSGPVVVDMFCLLRLELELSVQAKAALLARESGLLLPIDSDLTHSFREIEYLRTSIGRTGLLALKPLQVTSGRDLWHRHLLAS